MKETMKNNDKKKMNWLWIVFAITFVVMGFIMGMVWQQFAIVYQVAYILSFTNIDVDVNLNGTAFAEELNQTFIPAWKQAFNETMSKEIK